MRSVIPYFGLPYAYAERMWRNGMISDQQWRLYDLTWTWAAPRLGGHAGALQDRYARRCGQAALDRRRARALAHFRRYVG